MKRSWLLVALLLAARWGGAEPVDVSKFTGEDWYGLYMNGQKSGYMMTSLTVEPDRSVVFAEDAHFRLLMGGVPQEMRMYTERRYTAEGALSKVVSRVSDARGDSDFVAIADGEELVITSSVGGATTVRRVPRPDEDLEDALVEHELVMGQAQAGDSVSYELFEPMMGQEIHLRSEILAVEERMFEGAPTRVFKIKTVMQPLGIETISYVMGDGTTLEDIVSGMITMRLEPKEIAQDVSYNNDVIISNAAYVDRPIANPRTRAELRLKLKGPLTTAHLFNDERQFLTQRQGEFDFTARAITLDGFKPAKVPIEDPAVLEWIQPSTFVQSNDPRVVETAREIVGDEIDSFKIVERLCSWVSGKVQTVYSARMTNALEVLNSLEGDCTEHSILFIALARAAGLPAREVAGLIYVDEGRPGFYFHQWAKVWIGKWIDVDPTFNQPLADVTHIKLMEGDLFQQAQLIPVIGRLQVEVVGDTDAG